MATILLPRGLVTLVDDDDWEELVKVRWSVCKDHLYGYYFVTRVENYKKIFLHRQIMNVSIPSTIVMHLNHDTLDNRKDNLRIVTRKDIQHHRRCRVSVEFSSPYKGVSYQEDIGKWTSRIQIGETQIHIGVFLDEREAASAYNKAAIKYFGPLATLNLLNN